MGGDEESVMESMTTKSPGIAFDEDEKPVTEALGTSLQAPQDWAAYYEHVDMLETGALPPTVPGEPWTGDNFSE